MSEEIAQKLHEEGVALFRKGKLDAALEKLNQALQNTADESINAAEIHNDLGVIYQQQEDYPNAHRSLDKAEATFTALNHKKGQAQMLGNRAVVYQAEGRLEEAVETYKQSAQLLEEVGEKEMAMYVWQAISKLRTKQGQYIAAIGAYEEGVSKMPKSSFKRKVIEKILKAPASMLGGSSKSDEPEDPDK